MFSLMALKWNHVDKENRITYMNTLIWPHFNGLLIGIYLSNTSTLHSEADDRLTLRNVDFQECWISFI